MRKEKRVLFIDAFSTIHVGNGALLDNSYKLAKEYFNSNEITIISSDVLTNEGRYERLVEDVFVHYPETKVAKAAWSLIYIYNCMVYLIFKLLRLPLGIWPNTRGFKAMVKAIEESDVVVSISGESINDHFAPQMYMRGFLFYCSIISGKNFYLFPQSIGPIFRGSSKKYLSFVLRRAKLILARDKDSYALAKDIWNEKQVKYCPDVAVTQESKAHSFERSDGKKVIGLTLSDVPNEIPGSANYIEKVLKSISASVECEKYHILLMPSNYCLKKLSGDYKICLSAKESLEKLGFSTDILENKPIQPDEFQGLQKGLALFISSRMHVGILATSGSVPTVMINTQHKIRGYMENISMGHMVLEYENIEEDMPDLVKKALSEETGLKEKLSRENSTMRELLASVFESEVRA